MGLTQQANATNETGAVDAQGAQKRVEDGVKRSLELRAAEQAVDARVPLSEIRGRRGRNHGGSNGQDGESGEVHFEI